MINTNLGVPCCLPRFDCNVDLPENDPANPFLKHLVARIELAVIQENTYRWLYSSEACKKGHVERGDQIDRLDRELRGWTSTNKKLCTVTNAGTNNPTSSDFFASIALNYFYHSTRLLVHRAGKKFSDQQQCRENARACLQIFARLNRECASIETAIVSRQIIRDHPLVPFFVLFANVIQDSPSEESAQDLHLMLLATEVLQHIEYSAEYRSYIPQFLLVASSCCEAAGAILRKSSVLSSPQSSEGFGIGNAVHSSNGNGVINGSMDPWAVGNRMWTSIVPQSPNLTAMVDTTEIPENWNFDFSHMNDITAGGAGTRPAGSGHAAEYSVHGSDRMMFWGRASGATLI